jgi:hypothetical protein
MAFEKEVTEIIRYIKKNDRGDQIVISKISDKESKKPIAVDIRQYFESTDGTATPTRKGIRIPYKIFNEILEVLKTM